MAFGGPRSSCVRPGAHSARHQDSRNDWTPCRMAWPFVSAGAHAPHSDETLGPTPSRGSSHSAHRLRSLAFLCSSSEGSNDGPECRRSCASVAWLFRLELGQNQMPSRSDYRFDQGQDRQFHAIATALPDGTLKDSKYKHIQRLFRTFPLDFSTVARFIVSQLPEGQYLLTLDRTNWKFGQTHINILCLAIVQQGMAIPVLSILLDKTGNSNTDERIPLINRFIELFGVEKIDGYLAEENSSVRNLFAISLKMK